MPLKLAILFLLLCAAQLLPAQPGYLEGARWAIDNNKTDLALSYLSEAEKRARAKEVSFIWYEKARAWEKKYWEAEQDFSILQKALDAYAYALRYSHEDSLSTHCWKKLDLWWKFLTANGKKAYAKGEYDLAVRCFDQGRKLFPERLETILYAGLIAYDKEEWEEARRLMLHLIDQGYHHPEAYRVLIHVARFVDFDTRKAVVYAGEGLTHLPEDAYLRETMALMLIHLDEYVLARPHLRWLVKNRPEHSQYLFSLARSYEETQNFRAAEWYYEVLLTQQPDHFDGWYNLGVLNYNQASEALNQSDLKKGYGHLTKAMYAFEEAEKINPSTYEVLSNLRNIYLHLHLPEKSREVEKRLDQRKVGMELSNE